MTLIDDASPETSMAAMLSAFIKTAVDANRAINANDGQPEWELLRNPTNYGFVTSVNLGMTRHPDHDIVLLNSDTEVPPGWLQRLHSAAYSSIDIGTVTPFSNSGSLASYPIPSRENDLPKDIALPDLDHLFQLANAGQSIDIPTGVGFCLFVRRDCLEATGMFDAETFGKGYGEENDFCLRASERGWKHILAADCFVFHLGRASFGDTKDERVRRAYNTLVERYPSYPVLIQRHFASDPARLHRLRVDALRLSRSRSSVQLASDNISAPDPVSDATVLLRLRAVHSQLFELSWSNPAEGFKLWFRLPEETDDLLAFFANIGLTELDALPRGLKQKNHGGEPYELFELVSRHGYPRLSVLQSCSRALAHLGLNLSETPILRPLAARMPQTVRTWLRRKLKGNGS